jgi:hypothetical protein
MQKTRKEGFLFGFEDNKNIEISNAILCDISSADWDDELNPNIKNMIQYYLSSKLDCILIGVFFILRNSYVAGTMISSKILFLVSRYSWSGRDES